MKKFQINTCICIQVKHRCTANINPGNKRNEQINQNWKPLLTDEDGDSKRLLGRNVEWQIADRHCIDY
jgi:hypothetical protein